jgi:hypothetical protein
MRRLVETLQRIPWTPILLVLLLLVMFLNWRATVRLELTFENEVKRPDYWETQIALQIQEINAEMDNLKAIKADADCLRLLHPVWCR